MGREMEEKPKKIVHSKTTKVKQSIRALFDKDEYLLSMLGEKAIIQNIVSGLRVIGYNIDKNPKIKKYKNRIEIYNKDNKTMILVTKDTIRTKHMK